MNEYQRKTNTPESIRLWKLEEEVKKAAEADPRFGASLAQDPLGNIRARFGDAMMPNEGEMQIPLEGGGFQVVFPATNAVWWFRQLQDGELTDELLEAVAGGNNCGGPQKHEYA